jgi:hypothetical protein
MRFREHRGGLRQAMETLAFVQDRAELVKLLNERYDYLWGFPRQYAPQLTVETIVIAPYVDEPDERIGWEKTYIVSLPGYGVLGFTDGPL